MPTVCWFRRDLRVHDHPALLAATAQGGPVVCLFVLQPGLLHGRFASVNRTRYLLDCLHALDGELRSRGNALTVRVGRPEDVVPEVAAGGTVHASWDASPFARARDRRVAGRCDLRLHDGVFIADFRGLTTKEGRPFTVYSPWRRAWEALPRRVVHAAPAAVDGPGPSGIPTLRELGFDAEPPVLQERPEPGEAAAQRAATRWLDTHLDGYESGRGRLDRPTSRMSQYLHFGVLSPRWLEEQVLARGDGRDGRAYRRELAWRDFYAYVLLRHPHVVGGAFRPHLDELEWSDDADALAAWKAGRTGFPLVDAGMRQLASCGWMHNRARMVVASFLTKDLHLDWRLGEAHFMAHLIDGDVANNNGGWQWAAGTGTDPQPFQRVFNPTLQQARFDPDGAYVRRWVPELGTSDYPAPIVDHLQERRVAIERYKRLGAA